jgi:signal transduction histidine kinase
VRSSTVPARLVLLVAMVAAVTLLHYLTSTRHYVFHNIYIRLYYAPIIVSAFWFGLRGSVSTALLVSAVYMPHVLFQWAHDTLGNPNRYLEILLFNIIGLVVGVLSEAERRQRRSLTATARELEESYERLKEQTNLLLETEEELMHADRLAVLGELSATLAHEVRNPLAAVKGAVEILREPGSSSAERSEFLAILEKEVERLNRVVDNYLSVAKRSPIQTGRAELAEVVSSVVALVEGRTRKQSINVQISHSNEQAAVPLNPDLLRQVILNLFLNSISAMPDGGLLDITTELQDGYLKISVGDTGMGMGEEEQSRVFDPFYTTKEGGSGLGLSIVKRIVEGLGGSVGLESQKGLGTRVSMSIPIGE